jgi:transcriptional regulator with XRE-family HTH domain
VKKHESVVTQNLANTVKTQRKLLGISQEELAFRVGIDRTYASQIERAVANPSLHVLCNLAKVLNLSLSQLLGEAEI